MKHTGVKHKQMQNKKPGTKNRRPVKLLRTSSFLKCLEQTTVEFVRKKPSFPYTHSINGGTLG